MKWLLANAGSIGMAFFLALLTWIYLWSEATTTRELNFPFAPVVHDDRVARLAFEIDGRPFRREDGVTAVLSGPRAEIEAAARSIPACVPSFETSLFSEPRGTFTHDLEEREFRLPNTVHFVGKRPRLTVHYVKLVEMQVPILATAENVEGRPMLGFRVQKLQPRPEKIAILAPADQQEALSAGIPVQNVRVIGQNTSFTAPGQLQLPPAVKALEEFKLDVIIAAKPDFRLYSGIPVYLVGPEDVVRRLKIEAPAVVDISVSGPNEVLQRLVPGDFVVYAEVDLPAGDLEPGSRRILKTVRGHVRNRPSEGTIDITVMPEVKPENRQVEVRVLPAR